MRFSLLLCSVIDGVKLPGLIEAFSTMRLTQRSARGDSSARCLSQKLALCQEFTKRRMWIVAHSKHILLILLLVAPTSFATATDLQPPPKNPYLADSLYPLGHGGPAQQDSLAVAGPEDSSRQLKTNEIDYSHVGPGFFGLFTSGPYADGKRVFWGNGLDRIVKIDHDTYRVISTLMLADAPKHYDEAQANQSIRYFDQSNDGPFALYTAFKEAQKLRSLASVYTLLDNTNTYYIANKKGYLEAYGDADPSDPGSAIVLKRRFDFPDSISGPGVGINMTYDGWLVIVTEHGYLLAVKPDFKEYRTARLQHAQNAENKATRRTGYGWVRNAPALDNQGGIYVVSQQYMHKVVWTGNAFSRAPSEGAWVVAYDNTWTHGSGATPSLMGFGQDADNLVVITDGNPRMNLLVYWRNEIPENWQALPGQNPRVAGILPVTMGAQNLAEIQSEQSVVVEGFGALVVNNKPRNAPWYLPEQARSLLISYLGSNPRHQPYGVQKFIWNPQTRTLNNAWVNNDISSPSSVPIVSRLNAKVYLIGARDNQWTLEAIDWYSGKETFHYVIGGQRYNAFFSGTLLDEAGRIHYGSPWGRIRLNPMTVTHTKKP